MKKRKSIGNKWYKDFVNFQAKRKEIEHLLKDKARRGSVYPSTENTTQKGYWATATEQDLAREVVNTLMEAKEHRKSVSEDLLKRKSVSEASAVQHHLLERPQRHSVSEFETTNYRSAAVQKLSTSEEIRVQRASISAALRERGESIDSDVFRIEPKVKVKPEKAAKIGKSEKSEKIEKSDSKEKADKKSKGVQKSAKKKEVKGKSAKGKTTKGKVTKDTTESKG